MSNSLLSPKFRQKTKKVKKHKFSTEVLYYFRCTYRYFNFSFWNILS